MTTRWYPTPKVVMPHLPGAACQDRRPDLFFPGSGMSDHHAKAICQQCPVVARCLEWALEHGECGVWGNTSEQERLEMRRRS